MNTINQNKTGYKHTVLGWIPEGWLIEKLGNCCLIKGEYGINAPAVEYSSELPSYLRITDIDDNGELDLSDRKSVNANNSLQYSLEEGDIVFARTGATVGKSYLHTQRNGNLIFAGFLIRFRTDTNKLLPSHLKAFAETKWYWDWVKTTSMRSGQPGINGKEYCGLVLPLPSVLEQQRIRAVLKNWDTAITQTTQLITLLRQRNKGLMQQLLTGRKRLAGFEGEWKTIKLQDVFERVTRKNSTANTNVVTVSAQRGFVRQNDFFNKLVASEILDNYFLIQRGEFVYNKSYSNGYPWGCHQKVE